MAGWKKSNQPPGPAGGAGPNPQNRQKQPALTKSLRVHDGNPGGAAGG